MSDKVIISIIVFLFSCGFGLFIYFMKKYFDLVKEHLESLFNPLRELLRQNAKATQNLCDRLMEIEKTYPQKFVHLNRQEPRCQKNEEMLFRHDSDIKVLKEKTSGYFSKN